MIQPTITIEEASNQIWDVIVIGAGPAGGLAAYLLAKKNLKVLLMDRQCFPRNKVCGCCLNGNAVAILEASGLGRVLSFNHAVTLDQMFLASGNTGQSISLHHHQVLSRERLDSSLIEEAIQAGASFLDDTAAELGELLDSTRMVALKKGNSSLIARGKVVIAADGLGGRLLVRKKITSYCAGKSSRIGAGVVLQNAPDFYTSGKLFMVCGNGGYLGLVRLEDGRLNLAAALDPAAIKKHGSIGLLAKALLEETAWPAPLDFEMAPWRGTPALTGHISQVSAERLFVLGDAAGYIEPFTGEGMAWALSGARLVVPMVAQAVVSWRPEIALEWQEAHKTQIANRQGLSKAITKVLQRPWLVRMMIRSLKIFPFLSAPLVAMLDKPGKAAADL